MIIFVMFVDYIRRDVDKAVLGKMVDFFCVLFQYPSIHWNDLSLSLESGIPFHPDSETLFSPYFPTALPVVSVRSRAFLKGSDKELSELHQAYPLKSHHYSTNRKKLFKYNLLQSGKEITLKIKRPEFINTSLWFLCVKC